MKIVTLTKKNKILKGEIRLPASKSISNRALIIKHLSRDQQKLINLSTSDDTQLMIQLLDKISNKQSSEQHTELNCKNAGTVIRFLTALLAITPGNWILTGSERMKERPLGILVDALIQLGAEINYLEKAGYPSIQIKGKPLKGAKIEIDGSVSSQFISALLLIAPKLEDGLHLSITSKISSLPYVKMTLKILKHFGINYTNKGNEIHIHQQDYECREFFIEPDWSAAGYWYEMVALADEADIVLKELYLNYPLTQNLKSGFKQDRQSLQGDAILPEIYKSFAVETKIVDQGIRLTKKGKSVSDFEFDFTNYPDLAQSVIVTCAALGINGTFIGLESLRIKETDRLKALQTELKKLGYRAKAVRNSSEGLHTENFEIRGWEPGEIKNLKSKIIDPSGDHRMAMAFAPLVCTNNCIQISNPQVVTKSYPDFWKDLNRLGLLSSFSK